MIKLFLILSFIPRISNAAVRYWQPEYDEVSSGDGAGILGIFLLIAFFIFYAFVGGFLENCNVRESLSTAFILFFVLIFLTTAKGFLITLAFIVINIIVAVNFPRYFHLIIIVAGIALTLIK